MRALPPPQWLQFLEAERGARKISRTGSFAEMPGFAVTPSDQPQQPS
jgi:hypothetical protein